MHRVHRQAYAHTCVWGRWACVPTLTIRVWAQRGVLGKLQALSPDLHLQELGFTAACPLLGPETCLQAGATEGILLRGAVCARTLAEGSDCSVTWTAKQAPKAPAPAWHGQEEAIHHCHCRDSVLLACPASPLATG